MLHSLFGEVQKLTRTTAARTTVVRKELTTSKDTPRVLCVLQYTKYCRPQPANLHKQKTTYLKNVGVENGK